MMALAGIFADIFAAQELGAQLKETFDRGVQEQILNPHCGLCLSKTLTVEVGRTPWRTMDEARPHLPPAGIKRAQ
jgi:hypothetical protein